MQENFDNIISSKSPTGYSLDNFLQPPKQLEKYKIGGKVTRENFNDFLIQSFAISRGKSAVHLVYFEWLQAATGFDYGATFKNFVKSGGFNSLTEAEQQSFFDAFMPIKKHEGIAGLGFPKKDPQNPVLRTQIVYEINQLAYIGDRELWPEGVASKSFDMSKIKTYEDFTTAKNNYFASLKQG